MTKKPSFCIHAHFYQPPRENPFTGIIPKEPGAAPFSNWNEETLATCYRPNVEERNFSALSFNLGPTLAKWMGENAPEVLEKIVQEDRLNETLYGIGNALAQPYNHTILPLANIQDKRTQVIWGIRAFEKVFGREPEGIWLPETAADIETLRILAENNIKFTILAPWQVKDVEGDSPYCIDLGEGKSIVAFVYHGGLSSTVSFDTFATSNADAFAEFYIKPEINPNNPNQFLIIASDGELYGHHQPYRDKFLSHLLNGSVKKIGIRSIYPGLWLKNNTVTGKARLIENTSWSCHHGVERWRGECGCSPANHWKAGMRQALDLLAEEIDAGYREMAAKRGFDPHSARNEYIHVILGDISFDDWLQKIAGDDLSSIGKRKLSELFKAQQLRQQMFTSCGWFFDKLSRIEPVNNLRFAAQAAVLMESATGTDYHTAVLPLLKSSVDSETGQTAADYFMDAYQRFSSC